MNESATENESFRTGISNLIPGMLYISESEAGLELLPADARLVDQETVAATFPAGTVAESGDAFLRRLCDSIDPADDGLRAYQQQWEALFAFLEHSPEDVRVYRLGSGPIEIRIVAIMNAEALIIRTSAVET